MGDISGSANELHAVLRSLSAARRALPTPSTAWRNDSLATAISQVQQARNRLIPLGGTEHIQQVLAQVVGLLGEAMPPRGSLIIDAPIVSRRSSALERLDLAIRLIGSAVETVVRNDLRPAGQASGGAGFPSNVPGILVTVEVGSAPPEAIADLLSDLSILYRKLGGSGINFTPQDVHVLAPVSI